jgi:hypothetical protein
VLEGLRSTMTEMIVSQRAESLALTVALEPRPRSR